ncbi:M3 family metallopeptidase [Flavobacteriaceae bacterium]|nr:M3 family metallopeptidase [Flavobacteriaceae bacterium]
MKNPLLVDFSTPFATLPFEQIKTEDFLPAITHEIEVTLKEIETICTKPEEPTFENTLEAIEKSGAKLGIVSGALFNLNSAETSAELQEITQKAAPLLTKLQNDIRLNATLFERIKTVFEGNTEALSTEQKTLLEKEYKGFVRNGALLNEEEKNTLRDIDQQLAKLSLNFGEHVLADTNAYSLHITEEEDLRGLPESAIGMAKQMAEAKHLDGWLFTLDYPSYVPFMTYAENRELRKQMSHAFGHRGFQQNENNNEEIILSIVKLKHQRAALLGYESHAAFVLEERMAKDEETVVAFLSDLKEKSYPKAKQEWEEILKFGKERLGYSKVEKWDSSFISEKIKQERFSFNEEELKPYFSLPKVLKGLFHIVEKLYGLSFEINPDIEVYHPDVLAYEVKKDGAFHAVLYADFHPREGKRNGAWMTSYRSQSKDQRPHISIVCNFSLPTKETPALLSFNEVTTLFHEFGHALHGMLANTTYSALSGTSVSWDFVELPSQVLENWCYQPEALALFAQHYTTNELIPQTYIDKIIKAGQFQQGLQTLRQLSFSFLDLSWHGKTGPTITNVKAHEKTVMQPFQFSEDSPESCMSTAFSHIFQGGYSAGYYSYKWAEVLDADAFELFLEKGIFDSATAQSFHDHVLSKGGTEHPMELYKRFRGKEPNPKALLKRAGLLV